MISVLGGKECSTFNQDVSGSVCYKVIWKSEYLENFQGRLIRNLVLRGGAEKPSCTGGGGAGGSREE